MNSFVSSSPAEANGLSDMLDYFEIHPGEMIAIFQISLICTTCNVEHRGITFNPHTLRVMSEENGHHVISAIYLQH